MRYKAAKDNGIAISNGRNFRMAGAAVCVLFFVLAIAAVGFKSHYYVDETLSYILANNAVRSDMTRSSVPCIQPAQKQYTPASLYLDCVLSPRGDHQLDFAQVLKNQANDVHPPFYYIILHTICSFVPGLFSKWFAGAINIIFALLTLITVRKLARLFTDDEAIVLAVTCAVALSSTILNSIACLRMYIMAMYFVTLYTYMLVRYAKRDLDRRFYAAVFAVTLLGTLTHYYCALYFALCGALFALYLLIDRHYRQLAAYCGASLSAVAAAFALFPAMAQHLLKCYRATDSRQSLLSLDDMAIRLKIALPFINELFGGLLLFFAAAALALCIYGKKRGYSDGTQNARGYSLIFIPALAYFLVVAKTSPLTEVKAVFGYEYIRYFVPLFALALCGVLTLIFTKAKELLTPKAAMTATAVISMALVCANFAATDWNKAWTYMGYRNDEWRKSYEKTDFVLIGESFPPVLWEACGNRSVTFFDNAETAKQSPLFRRLADQERLVIGTYSNKAQPMAKYDAMVNEALGEKAENFRIQRKPYFYEATHYAANAQHGYVYYIERT